MRQFRLSSDCHQSSSILSDRYFETAVPLDHDTQECLSGFHDLLPEGSFHPLQQKRTIHQNLSKSSDIPDPIETPASNAHNEDIPQNLNGLKASINILNKSIGTDYAESMTSLRQTTFCPGGNIIGISAGDAGFNSPNS